MISEPIYSLRVPDVYKAMETTSEGLASSEAESRRSLYGENRLSEQRREPVWEKPLKHLLNPLAGVLLLASLSAFILDDPVLGGVIFILPFANAGLSFWREYRAEQAIQKLQAILPSYAHVLRDGKDLHLPAHEIVPGDILILAEGDNIPADARVVEEYGLRTNNSTLTGESVAARKIADASFQRGISDLEQPNLIFAGTSVAAGTGRAVVYSTGMLTQFGRIVHLTQSVEPEPSPFQKELNRLSQILTIAAFGVAAIVVLVGLTQQIQGLPPKQVILLALGLLVAATPEGLPATLTLSLAIAVQRLAQKGVLAKTLNIVETLGSVSVICTDKSGTLTQNQMTVREIWVAGQKLKVSGVGYEPSGEFSPSPRNTPWEEDLMKLLEAACACNNSRLNPPTKESPTWSSLGDQTEVALKVTAFKAGINENALNLIYPRVHEIPFEARRKRMSTIHRGGKGETAFVKGAPREVLQLCNNVLIHDEVIPLTNPLREEILAANDEYARSALRVLAVAQRDLPARSGAYTSKNIERDLTFLGLMAMMDPPRPEVEQAIKTCRQAGIRIVMITGDYGLTAESLARRIGMLSSRNPRILTGAELDKMNDAQVKSLIEREVIFARMAPEHKMRLVSIFQDRGDVVAVTGDGVNDAPALRKADVGVAMGIVGTDVAKEAADIILTNDNFGAIVSAIEEGRAVYDNVRKFLTYIFSSNVPEFLPFLLTASLPRIPLALNVRQILAIDLGTDLLPAIALGMEDPEPDVMQHPPRPRNQPIINNKLILRAFLWLGLIEVALCYFGFFSVYLFAGATDILRLPLLAKIPIPDILRYVTSTDPDQIIRLSTTVFHAGVVMAQVGNAFACRSETARGRQLGWGRNRTLLYGVLVEALVILGLIYIQPLATHFGHVKIPPIYWVGLGAYAVILYGLEWIRKRIIHWQEHTHWHSSSKKEALP